MNIFEESINKGVPVETPIILRVSDLYAICSDKIKIEGIIEENFTRYKNFLNEIAHPEDIELFQSLGVVTDEKSLEKSLCFAPSAFISSIFISLNIDDIYNKVATFNQESDTNQDLHNWIETKAKDRLELLAKTNTEEELKEEFPALYIKYKKQDKLMKDLITEFRAIRKATSISTVKKIPIIKRLTKTLQRLGFKNEQELIKCKGKLPVDNFCIRYKNSLEELIDKVGQVTEYVTTHPLNFDSISEEDSEKLSLYIANQFLQLCDMSEKKDKQRYLYHLTSYFNEKPERKVDDKTVITIGKIENADLGLKEEGGVITPKVLYNMYKQIVVENPELHVIDFAAMDFSGMNLAEVESFMIEYLQDLKANWEIIPPSEMDKDFIPRDKNVRNYLTEEERQKKQEKLVELYMQKKDFYDRTDPFFRIIGKNTFEGYVGHIYTNGKVVLDKFFENQDTGRVAENQAIYVMDISDFYRLSSLPKQELIHNPLCKRIYHAGNWQGKIQTVIEDKRKSKTVEELKELIKTGNVQK